MSIVVVGSSNTDLIIKVPRIPKPGETILGGEFSTAAGGKGANQAIAAARAGGKVSFIARIGDDNYGLTALTGFRKNKINTEYVTPDPDIPSGTELILVDEKGENSIAVASGANARLSVGDVMEAKRQIEKADLLLMQLETPIETIRAAATIAGYSNTKVILNPAPAQVLDDDLLSKIDIVTPNESEAELLTGIAVVDIQSGTEAAHLLLKRGVKYVVITMGSKGALLCSLDESQLISGFSVKPVDTTAAGDTFNGALALAISEGQNLPDSVRFANAAAALSVTKLGAQPSIPDRTEIIKLLGAQV